MKVPVVLMPESVRCGNCGSMLRGQYATSRQLVNARVWIAWCPQHDCIRFEVSVRIPLTVLECETIDDRADGGAPPSPAG